MMGSELYPIPADPAPADLVGSDRDGRLLADLLWTEWIAFCRLARHAFSSPNRLLRLSTVALNLWMN
jgi:hypothetical protein